MYPFCLAVLLATSVSALAAEPNGVWKVSANAPDGRTYEVTLSVSETAGKLSASIQMPNGGSVQANEVAFTNGELTFKLPNERVGHILMKLRTEENTLRGTLATPQGETGTVTGTRVTAQAQTTAAGKWKAVSKGANGSEMKLTFEFAVTGKKLTGTVLTEGGDVVDITGGALDDTQLQFKVETNEGAYSVTGTIAGDRMQGTFKAPDGSTGSFTASRS